MSMESYRMEIVHPNGARGEGRLLIGNETPNLEHRVHLTLHVLGRKIQAHAADYFAALSMIRLELQAMNLVMDCWGASRNVSVSAACEEETLGRVGCRLTLGRPVMPADYVNIFDSGQGTEPCTVDAQKEFHRNWLESLGWQFDKSGKMTGKTLAYNPYKPPAWVQMRLRLADLLTGFRRKPLAG